MGPPKRRNDKASWRAAAKWLEQNCEEFRESQSDRNSPTTEQSRDPRCGTINSISCRSPIDTERGREEGANCAFPDCTLAPASETPRVEPQCPRIAPESPQSASFIVNVGALHVCQAKPRLSLLPTKTITCTQPGASLISLARRL